jgi:hypothetical protein
MRTKHLGLDAVAAVESPSDQVVRISGKRWSEFPEPTAAKLRAKLGLARRPLGILYLSTSG